MNQEEALKRLRELNNIGNPADAHFLADDILCKLLKSLGYDLIVDEWEKVDKCYS